MKHVTIPQQWEAREALTTVAFLERIIEAVWRAHGPEMACELHSRHTARDAARRTAHHAPCRPRHIRATTALRGIQDDDILF
jgi:hypothetical protein